MHHHDASSTYNIQHTLSERCHTVMSDVAIYFTPCLIASLIYMYAHLPHLIPSLIPSYRSQDMEAKERDKEENAETRSYAADDDDCIRGAEPTSYKGVAADEAEMRKRMNDIKMTTHDDGEGGGGGGGGRTIRDDEEGQQQERAEAKGRSSGGNDDDDDRSTRSQGRYGGRKSLHMMTD